MNPLISFIGEGTGDNTVLGGKGYGLDKMAKDGLPVPEGFTLTTAAYKRWANSSGMPKDLEAAIRDAMAMLESKTDRKLGGVEAPLLVSVRSGAPHSMPGMMDTVLNVGCTNAKR